jgi:lysozyme
MTPSHNFYDLIEHIEGLRLKAYLDSKGIPTIGIGTTVYPNGVKVKIGDTCTEEQAREYMEHHIATNIKVPATYTQQQFDSCLCLIYNIGQGGFNGSSLKRDIAKGESAEVITADFLKWNKERINGVREVNAGLTRRRKCEAYLFHNGENHPTFFE